MLWEPMDLALDVEGKRLYIITSMYPSLVTINLETNRQESVLPLYTPGAFGEGGWCWGLSQSQKKPPAVYDYGNRTVFVMLWKWTRTG